MEDSVHSGILLQQKILSMCTAETNQYSWQAQVSKDVQEKELLQST